MSDSTTPPAVQAIETSYAGCRFRSRLEARWAVFFDRIGISWRYEPEGFELADGTRYLPDFELIDDSLDTRVFVEIKGQPLVTADTVKVWGLSKSLDCEIYVLIGPPSEVIARDCVFLRRGIGYALPFCGFRIMRSAACEAIDAASSARFEFGESG